MAYASIQSAIDSYIITISNALKIPIHLFSPWKSFVLHKTKTRLNHSHKHPVFTVLDKTENKEYVIIPVDKASNNIVIICKRFYLRVLNKEITESGNFEPFNTTSTHINREYTELLKKLGDEQRYAINLPFIYWIPKFHKNPIGFRYITSGKYSCVNGMSKNLVHVLKVYYKLQKNTVIISITLIE